MRRTFVNWITIFSLATILVAMRPQSSIAQPIFAGLYGSRDFTDELEVPSVPGMFYSMILHDADAASVYDDLEYDADRGYGFEVLDPGNPSDDRFGPFDNSPNNRNKWLDDLPDQAYDSFIGFKNFSQTCDEFLFGNDVEDPLNEPCATEIEAEGGIFRVDVPNGDYRFVGVFGDADNVHAHRVLAQNGGTGPPADGAGDHVVLVHNHDQAQQTYGEGDLGEPGEGAYALVAFDDKRPPMPIGEEDDFPVPRFSPMDENGMPFLDGDMVAAFQDGGFELGPKWQNGAAASVPEPNSLVLLVFGALGLMGLVPRK